MSVYLVWVGIIVLLLTIYSITIWRRSAKTFRFQARLTILFLLFTLVPSIPLTLFISTIVTENTEFFLLPGIETTLENSQQTIKTLVEAQADLFHQHYPELTQVSPENLALYHINYVGVVGIENDELRTFLEVKNFPDSIEFTVDLDPENFESIMNGEMRSSMRQVKAQPYFEVYYPHNERFLLVIGYWIDEKILHTKENISALLRINKFKEKMVDPQLIWALSTVLVLILASIAIFAARKFSRGISEPIHQLVSGMQRIAAGDLAHQVQTRAKDEIKILVDSFNKMAADLHASQEKLVQTERIAAWREVARRISHEIKNPLTPIQVALYRLQSKIEISEKDREKFENAIRSINEEIESLRRLADEFSQFARLPQPRFQTRDLNDIIKSVVILLEAEPRGVKFKMELAADIPKLELDREQIKRVLNNLIKNSLEASSYGSSIIIRTEVAAQSPRKVKLTIADSGSGIPPEQLNKMFDPYFSTKKEGMGLGLPIAKRIIEDHQGEIHISSEPGVGTEIQIFF